MGFLHTFFLSKNVSSYPLCRSSSQNCNFVFLLWQLLQDIYIIKSTENICFLCFFHII